MPTINVDKEVKERLVSLQGFLQLQGERYSLNEVIKFLFSQLPEDIVVDIRKLKYVRLIEPKNRLGQKS